MQVLRDQMPDGVLLTAAQEDASAMADAAPAVATEDGRHAPAPVVQRPLFLGADVMDRRSRLQRISLLATTHVDDQPTFNTAARTPVNPANQQVAGSRPLQGATDGQPTSGIGGGQVRMVFRCVLYSRGTTVSCIVCSYRSGHWNHSIND